MDPVAVCYPFEWVSQHFLNGTEAIKCQPSFKIEKLVTDLNFVEKCIINAPKCMAAFPGIKFIIFWGGVLLRSHSMWGGDTHSPPTMPLASQLQSLWHLNLPPSYADGRRSKFLVRETRTRILVQEICPCVTSSRTSFVSYEKLRWIRTMFYSVRETWSHVIEMLRRYWLEVRFVFFAIFRCWLLLVVLYFFVFLAILLIIDCYPEKIKFEILYRLCHRSCFSYEKLGPSAISFIISSICHGEHVLAVAAACNMPSWDYNKKCCKTLFRRILISPLFYVENSRHFNGPVA